MQYGILFRLPVSMDVPLILKVDARLTAYKMHGDKVCNIEERHVRSAPEHPIQHHYWGLKWDA